MDSDAAAARVARDRLRPDGLEQACRVRTALFVEIPDRQCGDKAADGLASASGLRRLDGYAHPGRYVVLPDAAVIESGATINRGPAAEGAEACLAIAGELLRRQQDWRHGLANHDGCRGCAKPVRHGP